jgi:hypothetical protein
VAAAAAATASIENAAEAVAENAAKMRMRTKWAQIALDEARTCDHTDALYTYFVLSLMTVTGAPCYSCLQFPWAIGHTLITPVLHPFPLLFLPPRLFSPCFSPRRTIYSKRSARGSLHSLMLPEQSNFSMQSNYSMQSSCTSGSVLRQYHTTSGNIGLRSS